MLFCATFELKSHTNSSLLLQIVMHIKFLAYFWCTV